MTDDELLWTPLTPPTPNGAGPKRHRHRWEASSATGYWCARCGVTRDAAKAKRGRSNLRAGKDAERAIAKAYGGVRTGQYGGPDDVLVGELFVIQSKAGKTWFRQPYVDELDKLPRTGGRVPTLVVSNRPGPGRPTRRYVVRLLEDDVALHGSAA